MLTLKLDTKALENLLKDDESGKIKLELQQCVIEEFSRKHIKSIINEPFFETTVQNIKREARTSIEDLFGTWQNNQVGHRFELHDQIKNIIKMQSKTAVTYELDQVEKHVQSIYKETATRIKLEYAEKVEQINKDLKEYTKHLEAEVNKIKEKLVTEKVDGILRNHIKSILAETFAVTSS